MPLVTADPCALFKAPVEQGFLENGCGTADPGLEPKVHQMATNSHILHVHRPYFKPEHHKWEFSPQKSTSTQQYLWLSFSPPPFQPDIAFTPFKLPSFCIRWSPGLFAYRFSKLCYPLGLYYHLVFQSLCLPASLPSITLSDRI